MPSKKEAREPERAVGGEGVTAHRFAGRRGKPPALEVQLRERPLWRPRIPCVQLHPDAREREDRVRFQAFQCLKLILLTCAKGCSRHEHGDDRRPEHRSQKEGHGNLAVNETKSTRGVFRTHEVG